MSFLLLFQPQQESPGQGVAGLELGSLVSASGSFDLDAAINLVGIAVDHDGADVAIELFTNFLTFGFGAASRPRVFFDTVNTLDITAAGRTSCRIEFEPEPSFDILVAPGGQFVIEFLRDESARFFDIAVESISRAGVTFARSTTASAIPESGEDIALRYREFIV